MADRSYLTALFDDAHAASGAIAALAGCGGLNDDICVAMIDAPATFAFCAETGAIPMDSAVAQRLREVGISIERATYVQW